MGSSLDMALHDAPARLERDLLIASTTDSIPDEPRVPSTAPSLTFSDSADEQEAIEPPRRRRASTRLLAQSADDIRRITGESTAQLLGRCCGGGCCMDLAPHKPGLTYERVKFPDNHAYRALLLKIDEIPTVLTEIADLPEKTVSLEPVSNGLSGPLSPTDSAISVDDHGHAPLKPAVAAARPAASAELDTTVAPPSFVQPHPPYHVFPARIHNARELTRPGAEKRTYHFDLDVTDYPDGEGIDFKVGGAIGVVAPNEASIVDEILDLLIVPRFLRDRPVLLRTTKGYWPTVWGDDQAHELVTTRRDLLTWCSDVQSLPPTKGLLRLMAEHATDEDERRLLLFLCSAEGQGVFCDFRTGPHISLVQLLHAFPSAQIPLDHLLSILPQLMPRFYSLSADPHDESSPSSTLDDEKTAVAGEDPAEKHEQQQEQQQKQQQELQLQQERQPQQEPQSQEQPQEQPKHRRVIEIAVTVHETADWRTHTRPGIGSGFLERQALAFLEAEKEKTASSSDENSNEKRPEPPAVYVPIFKGLMANPLAKQFMTDGPMLLIGAGVGIAPFRGFVQRRLKTANCANKVWVLQGIRDSTLDELYSGEWGAHEGELKRVVESRGRPAKNITGLGNDFSASGGGGGRYVQEEVREQADLVWYIINAVDGRVFVCGSSRGMGEGVEEALVDVAMRKGNLGRDEARRFWELKKEAGQYIAETW